MVNFYPIKQTIAAITFDFEMARNAGKKLLWTCKLNRDIWTSYNVVGCIQTNETEILKDRISVERRDLLTSTFSTTHLRTWL